MSKLVKTVLNPVTGKYIQSLVGAWKFYMEKSYDFEILRYKLQMILKKEELALELEKEYTKQLGLVLRHHSYRHLLDTIKYLVLYSDPNSFAAEKALENCLKQLEHVYNSENL